jgi:hypothetical protein
MLRGEKNFVLSAYKVALDCLRLNGRILIRIRASVFINSNTIRKHQPNTTVCLGVFKWQPHLSVAYSLYNSRLNMFNEIPCVRSLSLHDLLSRYNEDETHPQAAHA